MNIIQNKDANKLNIALEGRLDTVTSPELEAALDAAYEGVEELVFDFAKLDYISSAGLRVLLKAQKKMSAQGSMEIYNVNETIMEILEITGFIDILTVK